ncbi:MAG: hypothetical protein ACERKN_08000 [Velocimicrobium sp.]
MNSSFTNSYQKVAEKCSEYSPLEQNDRYSNAIGEGDHVSCVSCEHFESNHCNLDLYDRIVNEI